MNMNRIVLVLVAIAIMVASVSADSSPVINSVTLNTTTPEKGAAILVTVNVTDDIGVENVTANGIELVNRSKNIWNGTITALAGTHVVKVKAKDTSGNITWNNSVRYRTRTISGGFRDLGATIIVRPNNLNLVSKGKFTIFVLLPGGVNAKDINLDTVEVQGIPAVKAKASKKNGGTLILKFDRENFTDIIGNPQVTQITVTGYLNDGTYFEGSDALNSLKVVNRNKDKKEKGSGDRDSEHNGQERGDGKDKGNGKEKDNRE